MKARLMHRDRDFDLRQPLPWNEAALTQDLELNTLFNAMAQGDEFIFSVVRNAVFTGMGLDQETILYRQHILRDCLKNPSVTREIYDLILEALESKKKATWFIFSMKYPDSILHTSLDVMAIFLTMLKKLRIYLTDNIENLESEGFRGLSAMLSRELDDKYLARVEAHLKQLKFRDGTLISATLGMGGKGIGFLLRKSMEKRRPWYRLLFPGKKQAFTYFVNPRDVSGSSALQELNRRGINAVANSLAQSVDHIENFILNLKTEMAFYIGCLNLNEKLSEIGEHVCFPEPAEFGKHKHHFKGLYDVCLSLTMKKSVTGNDLEATDKNLVIITGANQGGKSTFLRSIGLAQLMMQCGMYVPADSFNADLCSCVITHYKREEDKKMNSGKLDEELTRMSEIVDNLKQDSLVLFNESFAATNEREGSEIARQIISALTENRLKIFFVTHRFEFAYGMYVKKSKEHLFLRAERQPDSSRTFRLSIGEPLQTSFGEDLYKKIFSHADTA